MLGAVLAASNALDANHRPGGSILYGSVITPSKLKAVPAIVCLDAEWVNGNRIGGFTQTRGL